MEAPAGQDDAPPLVEGRDYYVDPDGRYAFTPAYLLARGTCCQNGCRHCPYGFVPPRDGGDVIHRKDDAARDAP